MAPEQAKGRPVDKRSDVWAFGCVLYEMLAGRRAFEGDDAMRVMDATRNEEPPRLPTLRSDCPEELADIVRWGLSRHVDNRPTMAAFRARLDLFMRDWSARQAAGVPNLHSTMLSTSAPNDDLPLAGRPTQAAVDPDRKDFRMRAVAPDPTRPNRMTPPPRQPVPARTLGVALTAIVVAGAGAGAWFLTGSRSAPSTVATESTSSVLQKGPSNASATPQPEAPPAGALAGHVRVVTTPAGATVWVDGDAIGETPLEISGQPGEMKRVRLTLQGYADLEQEVRLGGGVVEFMMKRPRTRADRRTERTEPKKAEPVRSGHSMPEFGDD
jgi:serine/threonine-protein kinase